jgi:hypothetical protein
LLAARDFAAGAYAHCKFIGDAGDPGLLFESPGLADLMEDRFVNLGEQSIADFISGCAQLRSRPRQASIAGQPGAAGRMR